MPTVVYKICGQAEWQAAGQAGVYAGSPDDARDGFIHLSDRAQVAGTAQRHFAGRDDLLLVALDASRLGPALQWEPSSAGALFPHLHGRLPLDAVLSVRPLPLGADGRHVVPAGVV